MTNSLTRCLQMFNTKVYVILQELPLKLHSELLEDFEDLFDVHTLLEEAA